MNNEKTDKRYSFDPNSEAARAALDIAQRYTVNGKIDWTKAIEENPSYDSLVKYNSEDKYRLKGLQLVLKLRKKGLLPPKDKPKKSKKKPGLKITETRPVAVSRTGDADATVQAKMLGLISECRFCPRCGFSIGVLLQTVFTQNKLSGL